MAIVSVVATSCDDNSLVSVPEDPGNCEIRRFGTVLNYIEGRGAQTFNHEPQKDRAFRFESYGPKMGRLMHKLQKRKPASDIVQPEPVVKVNCQIIAVQK